MAFCKRKIMRKLQKIIYQEVNMKLKQEEKNYPDFKGYKIN